VESRRRWFLRRSGRGGPRRQITSIVLAVVAVILSTSGPAAAVDLDLGGERLVSLQGWSEDAVATAAVERCADPGTARVPFHMEGGASGPFPGTFEETGVVSVGPRTGTTTGGGVGVEIGEGPVRALRATFRITSGDTTIEGVKWLDPSAGVGLAGCDAFVDAPSSINPGWLFTGWSLILERIPVRYRATITTPDGSSMVHGEGWVTLIASHQFTTLCPIPPPGGCASEGSGLGFEERFF
jgi:hypothetical protein